jgi:hypothetical protein
MVPVSEARVTYGGASMNTGELDFLGVQYLPCSMRYAKRQSRPLTE